MVGGREPRFVGHGEKKGSEVLEQRRTNLLPFEGGRRVRTMGREEGEEGLQGSW